MQKFSLILILLSIVISNCEEFFKCPTESPAEKDLCGVESDGFIFYNTCKKGEEICYPSEEDKFYCTKKDSIFPKEIGETCDTNEDCMYNICSNQKCTDKCGGKCTEKQSCESDGAGNYLCVDIKLKGESCFIEYDSTKPNSGICSPLLDCFNDKCVEYGSLRDGEECGEDGEMLCQSGLSYEDTCISLKNEPNCTTEETIQIEVNGYNELIDNECYKSEVTGQIISEYSLGKTKLFQNLGKRYSKLDKTKYKYSFKDKEFLNFYGYFASYSMYETLQYYGFANNEGKIDKNKCGIQLFSYAIDLIDEIEEEDEKEEEEENASQKYTKITLILLILLNSLLF